MTMKRWVLWLCIIALVVSEMLLFSANQQKSSAQAAARDAQHQLALMQEDVAQGRSTSAAAQNAEIARLRSENGDLLRLRNSVRRLSDANEQLSEELKAARAVMQQQQSELQAWETASQQAEQQMQAQNPPPPPAPSAAQNAAVAEAERDTCINNLRRIDAAKQQWALENNKGDDAVPTASDLQPYFKDGVFPSCPAGGLYSINAVGLPPTCSIPGHALPQ